MLKVGLSVENYAFGASYGMRMLAVGVEVVWAAVIPRN